MFSKKVASLFLNETLYGLCNFVTSILLARYLGPENFAIWGIILLIIGYGESFGRVKVDLASVYIVGVSDKRTVGDILCSVNIITLFSSLLIISIFLFFSEVIFVFLFKSFEFVPIELVFPICLIFLIQGFFLNYLYIFLAKEKSFIYGFFNFLRSFILLLLVVWLFLTNNLTIESLIDAVFYSYIPSLLFLISYFQLKFGHSFNISTKDFKDLLGAGTQYYLIGISSQINLSMPLIIASQFLNPSAIGVFTVAKNFSEMIFARMSSAFHTILYSHVSNSDAKKENIEITKRTSIILFFILSLIYIVFLIFSETIVGFLYGDQFYEVAYLLNIIMIGYLMYYTAVVFNNYLYGIGRIQLIKYFYIFVAIIQFIAGFTLNLVDSPINLSYLYMTSMSMLSFTFLVHFWKNKGAINAKDTS